MKPILFRRPLGTAVLLPDLVTAGFNFIVFERATTVLGQERFSLAVRFFGVFENAPGVFVV